METINGLYNAECIRSSIFHDGPYKTLADVQGLAKQAGRVEDSVRGRLEGSHGGRSTSVHNTESQTISATELHHSMGHYCV